MQVLDEEQAVESRRVLLVEDSSATQDLIELVLGAAGHQVRVASTGAEATKLLADENFDVVLCDFHLPDFSGLEVVHRAIEASDGRKLPRFVAITGDVRGLLADQANCEVFDRVVPKPLDVDLVCELVEQPPAVSNIRRGQRPARKTGLDELGLALMHWPRISGPEPAPWLEGIDAIVVDEARDLDQLWMTRGANLLPILDATGVLGKSADLDVSTLAARDEGQISKLVDQFHERRAELHADIARCDTAHDRLLGRMFVSGGSMQARLSHRHDGLAAWNTLADPGRMDALFDRLLVDELIQTDLVDRTHVCPDCRSARVVVREECPSCQSPGLDDASYLHHFRCAYQGPEEDFRQGDDLICPKCRRELSHFGRDYDRPGNLTICRECGTSTSEPVVAFVCTACHRRCEADAMPTRDIVSARLTEAGIAYARSGAAYLGPAKQTLRFGDFPLELTLALNRAARDFNDGERPFTVGYIRYDDLAELAAKHGARRARDTRRLWLETFQQAMDDDVVVARGRSNDFVLRRGAWPDQTRGALAAAARVADGAVSVPLDVQFQLFGPEDFAQ